MWTKDHSRGIETKKYGLGLEISYLGLVSISTMSIAGLCTLYVVNSKHICYRFTSIYKYLLTYFLLTLLQKNLLSHTDQVS